MPKTTGFGGSRAFLLLLPLALAATACVTRPLVDPQPIAAAGTPAQTRVAILRALIESNYSIQSERPGEIVARYSRLGWTMVVAIDYSDQVSVRYVDSENLRYGTSGGTPIIHRGYNRHVQRLSNVIGTEIALVSIGDGLPAVAAPPRADSGPQ